MARFRPPPKDISMKQQEFWIKERQAQWLEITTMGKRFKTVDNSGYIYKGKKHYDWMRGSMITGERYVENSCTCIPWKDCDQFCDPLERRLWDILKA